MYGYVNEKQINIPTSLCFSFSSSSPLSYTARLPLCPCSEGLTTRSRCSRVTCVCACVYRSDSAYMQTSAHTYMHRFTFFLLSFDFILTLRLVLFCEEILVAEFPFGSACFRVVVFNVNPCHTALVRPVRSGGGGGGEDGERTCRFCSRVVRGVCVGVCGARIEGEKGEEGEEGKPVNAHTHTQT
jgi:hypothetical protein